MQLLHPATCEELDDLPGCSAPLKSYLKRPEILQGELWAGPWGTRREIRRGWGLGQ